MYRFWDLVIEPVIEAAGARRVVEIGALRGDMTVRMLERLGADVELHVIDPVPSFDPSEHVERFRGRYVFHRDTSHNVLPGLPPVDVALVDGDHNWYTVYHELRMLAETARIAARPLPVIIMHDVLWPYGRRDLYYDPQTIPEEFRQPYEQRGMAPGVTELLKNGGLNPTLHNAVREGGPRNGVMTALEDFLGERGQAMRTVIVPFHFGLAIVVDEERLAEHKQLVAVLDELEGAGGRYRQLELAESVALDDLLFQHNVFFRSERRLEASARRYLGLLKGALLDEHYLENEVRIEYLRRCANRLEKPEATKLHDPSRFMPVLFDQFLVARKSGSRSNNAQSGYSLATMGRDRLEHLQSCLDVVRRENVAGDLVECGTGRGGGAIFMRGYLAAHEVADKHVWLADEFRGLAGPRRSQGTAESERPLSERSDLNIVREAFARFDLLDDRVRFLQGELSATLPDAPIEKVALLRVDTGSGTSTRLALDALYDRLSIGGFVVIDDYHLPETTRAVDDFHVDRAIDESLEQIDFSGACWRKLRHRAATRPLPTTTGRRAPIAPPRLQESIALSVVVVFYNMRREAERTLRSLTRSYQDGIEDLDYEVIAVENGSLPEEKLGEEFVRSFGPEFRYLDLEHEATPSPATALNRGIAAAGGRAIAVMIDGTQY